MVKGKGDGIEDGESYGSDMNFGLIWPYVVCFYLWSRSGSVGSFRGRSRWLFWSWISRLIREFHVLFRLFLLITCQIPRIYIYSLVCLQELTDSNVIFEQIKPAAYFSFLNEEIAEYHVIFRLVINAPLLWCSFGSLKSSLPTIVSGLTICTYCQRSFAHGASDS